MRVTPLESFADFASQVSHESSSQTQTLNNLAMWQQINGFGAIAALTGLVGWLGGYTTRRGARSRASSRQCLSTRGPRGARDLPRRVQKFWSGLEIN